MGIQSFFTYLSSKHPGLLHRVPMKSYSPFVSRGGSRVAGRNAYVDATLFLTKFSYCHNASVESAMDKFNMLSCALSRLTGKKASFVLDTRSSSEKLRYTSIAREEAKKKRLEERPRAAAMFEGDWRRTYQEQFKIKGLDLIISPIGFEAEEVCAKLARETNGFVVSEDSDSLVFGAPAMLRGVWSRDDPYLIDLNQVLKTLEISKDQLIDIGILAGCDFASKIPGVGIHTAVDAIKTHGCIEAYLQFRASTDPTWKFFHFASESFDYVRGRENFNRELDTSTLIGSKFQREVFLLRLLADPGVDERLRGKPIDEGF